MSRRGRLVLVPEIDVDRLAGCRHGCGERRVRRLAAPEVAERSRMLEVADTDGPDLREPRLDAVPRRVLEVEGESQRRVERAQQQLEEPFVASRLQRDPDRPEPVVEVPDTALEPGGGSRPLAPPAW